jgi:hypothetical protein
MTSIRWAPYVCGIALTGALTGALAGTLAACGEDTGVPTGVDEPSPSSSPPPSTTPPGAGPWLATVPASIRLDGGLPERGSEFTVAEVTSEQDAPAVDWCGPVSVPTAGGLTLAGWHATGPEYVDWRVLRLYESDLGAQEAMAHLDRAASACDGQRDTFERRESALAGDLTLTVVQTSTDDQGRPALGASIWEVVQRGNALLLTSTYGEWDPRSNLDRGIALHDKDVAPIADAMCVFYANPCDLSDVPNTSLADFPLDLGYPEPAADDGFPRGRVVETAFVNHLRYCGALGWDTDGEVVPEAYVGTTHGGDSDLADVSFRTLARYPEVPVAQQAMAHLRATVEACPEEEQGEQFDKYALIERDVGDESYLITHVSTYAGVVSSVELLDVVRVGDLVLLNDLMTNEQAGQEAVADSTAQLAAELYAFTGRTPE